MPNPRPLNGVPFNSARGRAAALASAKARAARKQAKADLPAKVAAIEAALRALTFNSDAHVCIRAERVRAQLDTLDARIIALLKLDVCDGQQLNWLCSAQEKLSEQERVLSGRPLPGSRRPVNEAPATSAQPTGPADE